MAYTRKNCGAIAREAGQLCSPCGEESKCSFCGAPKASASQMCQKLDAMKYV